MEDDVKIIRVSELVEGARPLSATATLNSPSSSRSVPLRTCSSSISNPSTHTPTSNSNPRVLTALTHPAIVVGTITLPSHDAWSYTRCYCFQFSDDTCTVCCDVLKFDAHVIGKEIRVYAWNFIPLKRGKGFLEIIKWGYTDSSNGLREKGLNHLNHVDSFPLVPSSSSTRGISLPSRPCIYGVLESVGPLTVVPCTKLASGSKSAKDLNSSSSQNLPGFVVEVICCECRLCGSKELLTDFSGLMADWNSHSFNKLVVVYFIDHAASWHSVITKLSGNRAIFSGMKRKLVFIGKESRVMYVTTNESVLHVCPFSKKWLPCVKIDAKERGKFGTYTGIVTGIHMQGMVVELDHDVWLLLTDQILTLPHSLRVGAIISVRNVHFLDPKFSWTKILILGGCVKISIVVELFSPFETVCHVVPQSPRMLRKFIESLPFSARLWALLLVSSLRKMFGGILSDKDLLGSNDKEGLAQMCASLQLPSSVFQNQNGAFMGLCRHDSYGCGRQLRCGTLKLVIPMSIFICHSRATLMRVLKSGNDCKLLTVNNHLRLSPCEVRSYGRSVRRIISSEDVGCLLLGFLKIAPSTGRLQLADATGCIDVLIPDLPSTWDPNELYEVMDYSIIVDGIPEIVDSLELCESETLSCRAIFNCTFTQSTKDLSALIHVHFLWKNVKCRNFLHYLYPGIKNDSKILEPGTYHLLRVSHRFPSLQKMSGTSNVFVEAILLTWILLLTEKNGNLCLPKDSGGQIREHKENCIPGNTNSMEQVSNKRQKLVKESSSSLLKDEFGCSIYELSACSNSFSKSEENKSPINSSCHQIPCLVTLVNVPNENVHSSAILQSTLSTVDKDVDSQPSGRKVLFECLSESFLKYQIGGYYIIKHHKKDCFCTLNDARCGSSDKVLLDSGKYLWSLSFVSDEGLLCLKSAYSSTKDILSPSNDGVLPKDQIERFILGSNATAPGTSSDVCLFIPANLIDLLEGNIMGSEGQGQASAISEKSVDISLRTGAAPAGCIPSSGSLISNCLFPEGKLISLQGYVVDTHDVGSSISNSCFSCAGLDALKLKGFFEARSSLCIHVSVDQQIVKIFGLGRKYALPTGFGPGVSAIFHRILNVRGQNEFMLLPVSYVVIKSVRVFDEPYSDRSSNLRPTLYEYEASVDHFSSGLISELNQCLGHKQMWLRCRVVAVFVLVLVRNTTTCDLQAKSNALVPLFDNLLAGFVLDDGSSLCCCWTNAERAATLLRLHEKLPKRPFESSDWPLKPVGVNDYTSSSAAYHLGRILKTHKRIIVTNYGSCFNLAYQNLLVSVASGNLMSSDENLLKFIIFNSCFGGLWNVAATLMNADEVRQTQGECHVEMEITKTLPNIWAKDVRWMSTLTEARNMVQQL